MKRHWILLPILLVLLASCARATQPALAPSDTPGPAANPTDTATPLQPLPAATVTSTATRTPIPPTRTPNPTPTRSFPLEGRGPTGFEEDVNPLTGLELADPAVLDRRPVVIKIENLPRAHRPQWGLSLADLVYEYYTEFGATRFAAVFYGEDAERVGPIRSGRFFDSNIIQMYKAVFVYGMAYPDVQSRFVTSNFANRLIFETNESCPALCRFDPNGQNLLVANTAAMNDYLVMRNVDNTRQNLDGMFFKLEAPEGGSPANQVFIRYSGAIYNRWDYDATSGAYLRFSDKENDINRQNEVYEQLTDRLNGEPIARQNVVMLCVPHEYYVKREDAEVLDIITTNRVVSYIGCDGQSYPGGTGPAYLARDGQIYTVRWKVTAADQALALVDADGNAFPFKPGQTWFQVIGASSRVTNEEEGSWRFQHGMTP